MKRLLAAFEAGTLLRPSADVPAFLDLSRALATAGGVESLPMGPHAEAMLERIEADHIVFVLADGLGCSLLQATLDGGSFTRSHLAMTLHAPFPTSTAVALTTLATSEPMARHGITGWDVYLPALEGVATILRFERRADGQPLDEQGIAPSEAYPVSSLAPRLRRPMLSVLPAGIEDSTYSRYTGGTARRRPYATLTEAIDIILEHLARSHAPTYTYLYVSRVDTLAHQLGVRHPDVAKAVASLDAQMGRLAAALPETAHGTSRLVLSADHGHLDAPPRWRHALRPRSRLARMLRSPPSGDPRAAYFHVQPGMHAGFRDEFAARYGDRFALLSIDEAEAILLFGAEPLATETRRRVGDFIAISLGEDVLMYAGTDEVRPGLFDLQSHHSGLTPDEVLVPLVIA